MPERDSLPHILGRWDELAREWDDRASARLQETCLRPLAEQTRLLEIQQEEIDRFLARMDAELEDVLTKYQ